jgi:hypothetical protein
VAGTARVRIHTAPATARTVLTPDFVSADVNADVASPRFLVAGVAGTDRGPAGAARAGCAAGYFLAARGSGQNPLPGNDRGYAYGLGSRAYRVYEDTRTRLGLSRSRFQANAVDYPAVAVNRRHVDPRYYPASVRAGVAALGDSLTRITTGCPEATVTLFGYSQGAHVAGSAFDALPAATKRRVLAVHLFADAARNPRDPGIRYLPKAVPGRGIKGSRSPFTNLTDRDQVTSWCYVRDLVCALSTRSTRIHGPEYDCYEDWAAHRLATRARDRGGWPGAGTAEPACRMVS